MKTTEELLVQRNTHIFMFLTKTHGFGEKTQLRNKLLHNKDRTLSARALLQKAAWVVWATGYGDSLGWTLTYKFLSKELESPRPVLWKGNN